MDPIEKKKERQRQYYLKNKERLCIMTKQWQEENKEHFAKIKHDYYMAHKLQARISRAKSCIREQYPEGEERDKAIEHVTKLLTDRHNAKQQNQN